MNDTTQTLPEAMLPVTQQDLDKAGFPISAPMAPGLAVFFNDALYGRCRSLAQIMSRADGVMPRHLLGKPEACFAIISRAITWNLDPYAVAMCTYQTPNGNIGFEGKLVQAILEASSKLEGGVTYEHIGDWTKVKGKFRIAESPKGGKYPVPTWTREDAAGLQVIVSAKVKGESQPRKLPFDLETAFPLNSPLWATAPERQVCYTAVRAFANQAMPGILMGMPFDYDDLAALTTMTNITPPRPQKETEFTRDEPKNGKQPDKPATEQVEVKPTPEQQAAHTDTKPPAETKPAVEPKSEPKTEATKPAEPKTEPAPQREPGDDSQPTQSAADELAAWYRDQVAEIGKSNTVQELMDLRDAVVANVDEAQAAEFKKQCGTRLAGILKAELVNAKTVKNVTDLRGKYTALLGKELGDWFNKHCDERQREILAATRKTKT